MRDELEVAEGTKYQSSDEILVYKITTTNVASSPTVGTVVVYDESVNEDVTSTVMPTGAHSDSGDVITLKPLQLLTVDHSYRIEVQFAVGSNTWECFFKVKCIR